MYPEIESTVMVKLTHRRSPEHINQMLNIIRQLPEALVATEREAGVWGIHAHVGFHLAVGDPLNAVAQAAPELGFFF